VHFAVPNRTQRLHSVRRQREERIARPIAKEERHNLTLEALADVDAGRLIDHEHVVAWAERLSTDNPLPAPAA
jgi:predicted transcriptional regulator